MIKYWRELIALSKDWKKLNGITIPMYNCPTLVGILFSICMGILIIADPFIMFFYLILNNNPAHKKTFLEKWKFHRENFVFVPYAGCGGAVAALVDSNIICAGKKEWYKKFTELNIPTPTLHQSDPKKKVLIKPDKGLGNTGISVWDYKNGFYASKGTRKSWSELQDDNMVISDFCTPHAALPYSSDSHLMRVITYKLNGKIHLFAVYYDINRKTITTNAGFSKSTKTYIIDPNNPYIENTKIPYFNKSLEYCYNAHKAIDLPISVWGIIITDDGPIFLEGDWLGFFCHYEDPNYYEKVLELEKILLSIRREQQANHESHS